MKKYNLSKIMKSAWNNYKLGKKYGETFAQALKNAWARAKAEIEKVEKAIVQGVVRMKYYDYKRDYADCQTVEGSYDKSTKTIEVMTKVLKAAKVMPRMSRNGLCPYCHTWCYGDCRA